MEKKTVTLGSQNQITYPNLHDSDIAKIEFLEDAVRFYFKLVDGQLCCIEFSGEIQLRCDNVLQGKIIFDVIVHRTEDACMEWVEEINESSFDEAGKKRQSQFKTTLEKFKRGDLKWVTINPSYGCEGIVQCKTITYFFCED